MLLNSSTNHQLNVRFFTFRQTSRAASGLALLGLALALTACGKKEDAAKPTQVIAKVGGSELSVHQLNFVMQGQQLPPNLPADQLAAVRKAALDRMVEQETLVQEAINKKVDRDPAVQLQLDAARKEILVRNHLQKIGSTVAPPNADAVTKFQLEYPELFKERHVFQFTEITLPRVPPNWPELQKLLLPTKTINEVAEVLRSKGISLPIAANIVRPAEDLPLESLKQINKLKDGEIVVYLRAPTIVIAQINARKLMPLEEARVIPAIEKFLISKTRNEAVQGEIKRVKEAAKITLLGEFASDAASMKAAAPVPEKIAPNVTAPPMPATPPTSTVGTPAMDAAAKESSKEVLEKGLKGLK